LQPKTVADKRALAQSASDVRVAKQFERDRGIFVGSSAATGATASAGRVHCLAMKLQMRDLGTPPTNFGRSETTIGRCVRSGLVALAVSACGGSEDGIPIDSTILTIALTATSTDESAVAVRSDEAALDIEEVGLSLSQLEIVPCDSEAAPLSVQNYPVELTVEPPAQANFESSVSEYCNLGATIEQSPDDGPPELAGLAVLVRGTRSDDVPFEVRSTLPQIVKIRAAEPLGAYLALGFDLATWFDGVDVEGASVTDGVALIDDETNPSALAAFDANTPSAVALYVDADRDGVLDADELEPIEMAE
jgi:hypothetical protein